MSIIEMFLIF